MPIQKVDFTTPEFLFCEIPLKDGSFHDHRNWLYHTPSLSLIEFIFLDAFEDYNFTDNDYFCYVAFDGVCENYASVFVQNNCAYAGYDQEEVLKNARRVYIEYLYQIDEYGKNI